MMTTSAPRSTPTRLLIVEDEGVIALAMRQTLLALGYDVVGTAATGETAVALALDHRPDLILMDVQLRGPCDGIEAARRIRLQLDVPIVFLTAFSDDSTLDRAKEVAPYGYLVKPFSAPEVHTTIQVALHRYRTDRLDRERERFLATTLQCISDGVIATDATQRVTLVNRMAELLTGWVKEDAEGRALSEVLQLLYGGSPCDPRGADTPHGTAVLLRDRAGNTVAVDEEAAPLIDEQGRQLGQIVVLRDASERLRAQHAMARANAQLEDRVAERTAELAAANQELEAFSYAVAHDLKAPLRGIRGFAAALSEEVSEALDDSSRGHLQRIGSATERMSRLIDDLLYLSRATTIVLDRQTVHVSAMAEEVVTDLQHRDPLRRVEVIVRPGLEILGDPRLVRVALENLLGNAWKFTARTDPARIEVGAVLAEAATTLYVRDNGAGFDMERAPKLFRPFQRLHAGTEYEGTGIGLATVHRIVRRHGGRIWCEAEVDRGATFYFTLQAASP